MGVVKVSQPEIEEQMSLVKVSVMDQYVFSEAETFAKTQESRHETRQDVKDQTETTPHYSHKTTTTTRTTVLQEVRKQRVRPSRLLSARKANVSTQNKYLAMPGTDTVKTQS